MKRRISILLFVPLVVFVVFAALLWALRFTMATHDREDVLSQTSGQVSRQASRLARIAEVNLDDHIGQLEEQVMFASIEMNASAVVVLDPAGRVVLAAGFQGVDAAGAELLRIDSHQVGASSPCDSMTTRSWL